MLHFAKMKRRQSKNTVLASTKVNISKLIEISFTK